MRPLRRALSCITDEYLGGAYNPARPAILAFPSALPDNSIRLRSDHRQLAEYGFIEFSFSHRYAVAATVAGWVAHTTGYEYALQLESGREIVAYHYDLREHSVVKTPHLHVRGLTGPLPLSRAHFPTGRIAIEDVIRFMIAELGVRPRLPDGRWQPLLAETEQAFRRSRTW